jgi:hypothetical protein
LPKKPVSQGATSNQREGEIKEEKEEKVVGDYTKKEEPSEQLTVESKEEQVEVPTTTSGSDNKANSEDASTEEMKPAKQNVHQASRDSSQKLLCDKFLTCISVIHIISDQMSCVK